MSSSCVDLIVPHAPSRLRAFCSSLDRCCRASCPYVYAVLLFFGCQHACDAGEKSLPELVGATNAAFELGRESARISFQIRAPKGPALPRRNGPARRAFLNIENITSDKSAPSYSLYLNIPPGARPQDYPDQRIGNLALFGLVESSHSDQNAANSGLSLRLEVTSVYAHLVAASKWDAQRLHLTFVPRPWDGPVKVRVGRVSLYLE